MKNIFKETIFNRVKYSKFDLSHDRKFSCQMGELVPILCEEILPGDRFSVTSSQMIRLAPMLSPVMHRVDVYTHFFFVPNRIIWNNWEKFISPEKPELVPEHPYFQFDAGTSKQCFVGSIGDYLGLPTQDGVAATADYNANALPFAAYTKIYNEYYRDQNLIDPLPDSLVDGINSGSGFSEWEPIVFGKAPLRRCWEHDYFTACLPFAQKGDPVMLPLSGSADIVWTANGDPDVVRDPSTGSPVDPGTSGVPIELRVNAVDGELSAFEDPDSQDASIDNSANLSADLSTATSSSITDFRRALRLQEWLERNARGGTRYIENIFAHFGVKSSDSRLQRPEYLGGGKSPVMISEVVQTSATSSEPTPQGNLAGHGLNVGETHQFSRRFEEHGWIIGIMSVMPKTAYSQGLAKKWLRRETLDYAFPSFAHIGEQEVLNKEVQIEHAEPDGVFGYIPRYSEYRFINSSIHGDMRTSLNFWHMSRELPDDVALNEDFIVCNPTKRIFAVEDADVDDLWCHVYNKVSAVRPLPKYGIPTI